MSAIKKKFISTVMDAKFSCASNASNTVFIPRVVAACSPFTYAPHAMTMWT